MGDAGETDNIKEIILKITSGKFRIRETSGA
jgi:hypothetical protein